MGASLSQDEVDAFSPASPEKSTSRTSRSRRGGVRPYNLATQERIVRGRMPTLEIINERFARLLRIGLFNFMRRTAEIAVGPVRVHEVQRVHPQSRGADQPESGAG